MRVAIIAIAKMENHYIKEFVDHYLNLGVDQIFIGDNNSIDGEKMDDVLQYAISSGKVQLINCRGKRQVQCDFYLHEFNRLKKYFDWIGFFDIDELLDVGHYDDVKNMLSDNIYDGYEVVRIPWKIFTDSDIVEVKDGDYRMKGRFTDSKKVRNCKAFVRTSSDVNYISPHGPLGMKSCDPYGNVCYNGNNRGFGNIDAQLISDKLVDGDIWVDHYIFKTIDEYIHHKMVRLYPDKSDERAREQLCVSRFWMYNKRTKEKEDYIRKLGLDPDE